MANQSGEIVRPNGDDHEWFEVSKEKVRLLGDSISLISQSGQEEIERGKAKVDVAASLNNDQKYLSAFFSKDINPNLLNNEQICKDGQMLAGTIDYLYQESSAYADSSSCFPANGTYKPVINTLQYSSDISSASAVYIVKSIETKFMELDPTYLTVDSDLLPNRIRSSDDVYFLLRNELSKFGHKYVIQLEGSKAGLESKAPDSLSQAAHSMRDCFELLIKVLAPDDSVKSQPWFQPEKNAPSGVTRRSRLRYIFYKSGAGLQEGTIRKIDDQIQQAVIALNDCINLAHKHDLSVSHSLTKNAIELLRSHLLDVIKVYNQLRN